MNNMLLTVHALRSLHNRAIHNHSLVGFQTVSPKLYPAELRPQRPCSSTTGF